MTQSSAFLAAIVVAGALSVAGCSKEPDYATIEGTARVLLEYGGTSEQGIALTIPAQEILIKPVDTGGAEYRGVLMPEVVFMSESGSRRGSEPLSLVRSGRRYRFSPVTAGIAGLMKRVHPELPPAEVERIHAETSCETTFEGSVSPHDVDTTVAVRRAGGRNGEP